MLALQKTIPAILIEAAKQRGDTIAIVENNGGPQRSWSYNQLLQDAQKAAKAFMAAGIEKGDRFAIWAPNLTSWIIATLGGQMVGGVLVPLNTRYKASEAEDILSRSGAKLLFTVRGFLGADYPAMLEGKALPQLEQTILLQDGEQGDRQWQVFLKSGANISDAELEARYDELKPDDLCDILYTSGTTGLPKGAMTIHSANAAVYRAWAQAVGVEEGDIYLIANPFFHAFGYKAGWLAALIGGAQILPHSIFDAEVILERIQDEKVTILPGPPTIFQSLLNHPKLQDFDISSLKRTITGAASVPEQLVRDMKDILGFETVLTGYGLTEATGTVSLSKKSDDIETIAHFAGRPLESVEVKVVGEDGGSLAANDVGEIWVKGFNVMRGYLDDDNATRETITEDGWLKTGDIGYQNEDGYLKITDRAKDMFITGGFNCYPAEIENTLLSHDAILDVAVIGAPDDRMGEVCHAHIVLKEGTQETAESLTVWARDVMANFKVPRKIIFHDELPRNAGGKVQKFLLKT